MTTDTYVIVKSTDTLMVKHDVVSDLFAVAINPLSAGFLQVCLPKDKLVDLAQQLDNLRREYNF